jgi:uncharacterized protein
MPNEAEIRWLCQRIVEDFYPDKIVLFGSHAHGRATPESDVDLLVIMPYSGLAPYKALEIVNRVDPRFPVDLLVRSAEEVAERVALNDFFMREIMERGQVLYAASDAGVDRESRG